MIDTAKVRSEHIIMDRWGGPGTGRDEGGICSECEQFWGPQCSDLDWCDALDEANAKLKAVRILIGKYQEFDKDLDVRHSAMLSAARNSTILAAMDGADVV